MKRVLIVLALLLPWGWWTGGLALLASAPPAVQLKSVAAAAYGGVRILSQFYLLRHTSPTTSALSNVTVQAMTTAGGIVLFGESTSAMASAGIALTLTMSALYAALKLYGV